MSSEKLERYSCDCPQYEHIDGDMVYYKDHKRIVKELQDEIVRVRNQKWSSIAAEFNDLTAKLKAAEVNVLGHKECNERNVQLYEKALEELHEKLQRLEQVNQVLRDGLDGKYEQCNYFAFDWCNKCGKNHRLEAIDKYQEILAGKPESEARVKAHEIMEAKG